LRINQFLARAGLGSRRSVERFILQGRVIINNNIISNLASTVDPDNDIVYVDHRRINLPKEYSFVVLNKPVGFICSRKDPKHKNTVFDLLPRKYQHLTYGGRLDINSRGGVIFSNDGDFIYKITRPQSLILKYYQVKFKGEIPDFSEFKSKLKSGIWDNHELLRVNDIRLKKKGMLSIILQEGRKNHIRRLLASFKLTIKDLYRYGIGNLFLNRLHLEEGDWKKINKYDIFLGEEKNS